MIGKLGMMMIANEALVEVIALLCFIMIYYEVRVLKLKINCFFGGGGDILEFISPFG